MTPDYVNYYEYDYTYYISNIYTEALIVQKQIDCGAYANEML